MVPAEPATDRSIVPCTMTEGAEYSGQVPAWAAYLIGLGYRSAKAHAGKRRIRLVSLPCDSAGAGLIALGALRSRLENSGANDLANHFERIKRAASDGHRIATLRREGSRSRFRFDRIDRDGTLWLEEISVPTGRGKASSIPRFPVRNSVTASTATQWLFEGEAPIRVSKGEALPWRSLYQCLPINAAAIQPENLTTTDSAICLAARVAGEAATRNTCDAISIGNGNTTATLSQLLTIQGWNRALVSRVCLYNSRTDCADRPLGNATLAVADGDAAFLRILSNDAFDTCDVIGIYSRAIDRDRLDTMGEKVEHLRQWFDVDSDDALSAGAPAGVNTICLMARQP